MNAAQKTQVQEFESRKLSKNFIVKEFTVTSQTMPDVVEMQANAAHFYYDYLQLLCFYLLQPVRDECGAVTINSGIRCSAVNRAVGGVDSSQHLIGLAADFTTKDLLKAWNFIRDKLEFDQLIAYDTFIHVSFNPDHNRQQTLIKSGHNPKWKPSLTPGAKK